MARRPTHQQFVALSTTDSTEQRFGKFQLCKDEDCKAGPPINPSDALYIKDIHGQWLDEQAGKYFISKWPCGKYCLGGFEHGFGPACPSNAPAITFYSEDPQMCAPYELTEVPCHIKDDKNSCIWTNGADQYCDKMHCPA